jgi:hypothetical protein
MNGLHRGEIDHQSPLDCRTTGHIVPAPPHGDFKAAPACERQCINDVGGAGAAGDQRRALVDEAIMNAPCIIIAGCGRMQQLAGEAFGKLNNVLC